MKQLALRISDEASKRFNLLYKKSGLKTKGQVLEALIFNAGQPEDSTFEILKSIETKVDAVVQWTHDPV